MCVYMSARAYVRIPRRVMGTEREKICLWLRPPLPAPLDAGARWPAAAGRYAGSARHIKIDAPMLWVYLPS